ncbi:flavodoxin [Robinsoniella peoriensis]|uniref:flavodoxin n=1 Tax=Robinsoniella peoriensis TaxID=180332 RepID=UPI0009E02392
MEGKTIIPFATSGGSEMGNTNTELADSCKGADLRRGRRFDAGTGEIELKAWAKNFL